MHCRSCENEELASILSLGNMPLANRLLKHEQLTQKEPKYHLEILLCHNCGLVQLKEVIDPEILFTDYLYYSSNSESMISSVQQLVNGLIPTLSPNATILEIGSNDGYLLQHYLNRNNKLTSLIAIGLLLS